MFTTAEVLTVIGDDLLAEKESFDAGHGRDAGPGIIGKLTAAFGMDSETAGQMVNHYRKDCLFGRVGPSAAALLAKAVAQQPAALENLRAKRARYKNSARTPRPNPPSHDYGHATTAAVDVVDVDPFVALQQRRDRAERLFENAAHEAKHCCVGISFGAVVTGVEASDTCGITRFHNIPREFDVEISAAGSVWDQRTVWGQRASSDITFVDKAVHRENPAALPGSPAWHARVECAQSRCDEVLEREFRFYAALRDRLIRDGSVSGSEVHRMWDQYRSR